MDTGAGETTDHQSKCPCLRATAEGVALLERQAQLLDRFAALLDGAEKRATAMTASLLTTAGGHDDPSPARRHDHAAGPGPATPPPAAPRWGTVEEAAAHLDVSRDTLDRMRKEQREQGWVLPGEPVPVGMGKKRRRERWDLDQVGEWAAALRAKQPDKPRRKSAAPRRTARESQNSTKGGGGTSLYARAKARAAGLESTD